ncbi:MAG: aminopeptidase P family protein [Lachnospiraceae bacterium]|nr:aminopeptidase P family protein [Lachnospiraceae bacterium]
MIEERLQKLRKSMRAASINCYLIPTSDYHDSEYVSSFFMVRKYFSGFTGSAGTLVVSKEEAALFTDGRYFIQAAKELAGTEIKLMKMGEAGVPTIPQYLEKVLKEGENLGFDGRVVKADDADTYEEILRKKHGRIIWDKDLAEEIWEGRPALVHHPVYILEQCYSGEGALRKIERVRDKMKAEGADVHILTSLDDIAWLLNIRGNDVESCPVVLSYAVIAKDKVLLFAKENHGKENESGEEIWTEELCQYLKENGVELCFYSDFYDYISKMHEKKVLFCKGRASCRLMKELPGDVTVIDRPNPTTLMKAVKNQAEMENLRKSHLWDGVAVTHFMYWLKKNVGKISMTEVSAAVYLEELRRKYDHFVEPSFGTICAYGANGALAHYSAKEDACAQILPEGMLLVDSGGHYLEGTTDITRTFVLGTVTKEMKEHFTLVLRALLSLKNSRFLHGCRGVNLDVMARQVLWEKGLDYKHGTGHGVGYLLSVHEGPNSFRWKLLPDYQDNAVLEEGMVTTDEPGIYIEGSHGIRLENELLCRKDEVNEYGQFMYFEDLTCVPFDLDGVEPSLLTDMDRKRLNAYHSEVFEKLEPYFEGEELEWLREVTRKI